MRRKSAQSSSTPSSVPSYTRGRVQSHTRRRRRLCVLEGLDWERVEERTLLSTITWAADVSGDWDNPAMWSGDAVPGASDDAVIPFSDVIVTHDTSASDSVNSLTSQAAIAISGGSLSLGSASSISNTLSLSSGAMLAGAGNVTVSEPFDWQGGTIQGPAGSTLTAQGGAALHSASGGALILDGRTFNNAATATWSDAAGIIFQDGAVFHNLPGATFDDQTNSNTSSAGLFINDGLFEKSGNTGPLSDTELDVPFDQSSTGSVAVLVGSLSFLGGGQEDGSFTGDAGTTLSFGGQTFTPTSSIAGDTISFNGGDTIAGSYSSTGDTSASDTTFTGTVALGSSLEVGGTVSFAPALGGPVTLTTGTLTIDGGSTLTGTDSFVVNGLMTLISGYDSPGVGIGGTLSTSGTVDAYGGLSITSGNYIYIDGTTLNNHAAATWQLGSGGYDLIYLVSGATINNLAGASFTVTGAGGTNFGEYSISPQDGSAVGFNNAGAFIASASSGAAVDVPFANTGTVDVQQGTLGLSTASNSGAVIVLPGTTLGVDRYTQTAGSTVLSDGTITGGAPSINGGVLSGTGVINANVTSGGQLIPGGTGASGLLTINGNYTQTATGTLDIDIGGTTAGTQYDQLAFSGTATLGGTVDVALIDGFLPALGNTFQPLTFAFATGNFGFYNGIVLGNRLILDPALNPNNLTLTVQPAVTTTTLSAPASPSVSGQSVTFTAMVTVALPPTTIDPVPTGMVTFYDNGTSIGVVTLNVVSGQDQASLSIATLSTSSHQITAVYSSGDANFIPSPSSTSVTQVVNPANTSATVASAVNPSVYGQSVTFTATVSVVSPGSTAVAYPTGTVTFYDNGTSIGAGMLSVVSGQDVATFTTSALSTASHPITAAYTSGDTNFNASRVSTTISQVVNKDSTATVATASPRFANVGQAVTFTAMVTANVPGAGTPTGTVDFYDSSTSTDLTPGGVALAAATASFTTTSLAAGSHTIKATYSGDANFLTSYGYTGTVTIGQTIFVLDSSAGGALSLSGNAGINIGGGVYVDSGSSSALSASGNASVKASVIDVHGGVQKSGNVTFSPAPVTGTGTVADPLGSLAQPSTGGLNYQGSVSLGGNSTATIAQGIYSKISVAGNAQLTLSGGTYIIEGGGFSVSGNASVSGAGVLIVNAGSNYPNSGETYGSITLSGNGSYNLTPITTGTYAGIVIFQSRDNSKAITVSGNASGMTGTIYAPAAALSESGNALLNAALIVDTLSISGNGVANVATVDSPLGTVAYTPSQIRDAYGINALSQDGTGQTIAIVDAYDDPAVYAALDAFDSQFGLTASGPSLSQQYGPAPSFLTVLNQYGQATSLPSTDPNGAGTNNWEVEEALDVEWAHAIAPGAQIILVEANSQSLSDLMSSVATAVSQPGVSVVSMSWGFPEGQAVFAADEATYDGVFNVPGVTFVASTGDYGAADPEYPAFSPNVVAVGGTSLTLSSDNSYNSETGWGYDSDSAGGFIGSGGGISLYEPEPAFQQGVQSTGSRTTPDVALVADPATGAWIADPYNLDPSNPFEVVGGTSLSAPAWAALVAIVNQGRAAAGESALNSNGPTETQQALYSLPQGDYNVISSGNNGYGANPGYNLVTGLGTPVANRLVPDLVGYQGPGTSYAGLGVGPLQDATLTSTGTGGGGPIDVFSVFDALGAGGGDFSAPGNRLPAAGTALRTATTQDRNIPDPPDDADPQTAAGFVPRAAIPISAAQVVAPAVSPITIPIVGAIEAAPTRPGSAHRPKVARFRHARLDRLADLTASRLRSRPPVTALDRRAVDVLFDDLGMIWLSRDDGPIPDMDAFGDVGLQSIRKIVL